MNRRFGSVHINEIQGNPWQPDVSFRGYTASPLLGTPQGLSLYVDGIRFNQPFGDIVSWDLLPTAAIASIVLMPGSNPLFGLNTLGGALSVQTKDGATHPGTAAQVTAGGHGRAQVEVESGGKDERGLSWFGVATAFRDNGWRDDSGSRLAQAFGKLGWRSGATHAALTVSGASTTLLGNGLQDGQLLAARYASVYTRPDETRNRSGLVSIAATHERDDGWSVSGQAYLRRIDTRTVNGDLNDDALDQPLYGLSAADRDALAGAGIAVPPVVDATTTPFPYLLCVAQALQGADTELACNGVLHRSRSRQSQGGVSVQATRKAAIASTTHQLVVGAAFDASRTHFAQSSQAGFLQADRRVQTVNDFLGGGAVGAAQTTVSLDSRTGTASVFAADSIGLGNDVHLTAAARYDRTTVANRDTLQHAPDPSSLDGDHRFARLNPALGLNWNPSRALQVYAGYSEGSRTPTAIELGCANPAQPCKLPNAMAGDPPLKQVVARTVEAGVRGELAPATTWRAGVFRGVNRDDLLFVSSDASGQGYFRNFGKTRRQGVELGAATRAGAWSADFSWTLLDAAHRLPVRLERAHAGLRADDAGDCERRLRRLPKPERQTAVVAGDRLPLIPRQTFKASLAVAVEARTTLALDLVATSGAPARGNENGAHAADGVFYLGPGRSPGYAVVNFGATMQTTPALTLFARIANVLDRRYASAAQLGPTGFDAAGGFVSQPFPADAQGRYPLRSSTFYAAGAPRLFSLGLRYAFD